MVRVIINSDDFGLNNEVNKAIAEAFKKGLISSIYYVPCKLSGKLKRSFRTRLPRKSTQRVGRYTLQLNRRTTLKSEFVKM